MKNRNALYWAAIFGFLAVAFGAFGAHGLEDFLKVTGRTETFETAVKYQFYHTFLLLFLATQEQSKWFRLCKICCIGGVFVFCGSLYLLIFTGQKWLGAITPIGGLCFLASWILLIFQLKNTR